MKIPWLVLPVVAFVAACGASEEDVQREFDEFVAERNRCSADTECVLVFPGCPLGCFVAVNAQFEAVVAAKAEDLIDDYERGGTRCDYGCVQAGAVVCLDGRCATE
jgi:hypothetical protein